MRQNICINGQWRFAPIYDDSQPADSLASPVWDTVPIFVPSSARYQLYNVDMAVKTPEEKDFFNIFDYPAAWNQAKSGIIGRKLLVKKLNDMRTVIVLDAVFQRSKIYVNNKLMLATAEAFMPLSIDITEQLSHDEQEIELLVWCGSYETVETPYGKRRIAPDGTWFSWMSLGIWQDAWLRYIPNKHFSEARIETRFRTSKLIVDVALADSGNSDQAFKIDAASNKKYRIVAKVLDGKKTVLTFKSRISGAKTCLEQDWGNPKLWDIENPNLYHLQLELFEDEILLDRMTERFGFREIWNQKHKLFLNGKRINLRGDSWHYQGHACQTREYAKSWYTLCKQTGANSVRLHGMPYPSLFYDVADEMGMLIIDESAIYGSSKYMIADNAEFINNCREHLHRFVRRDRNHPCIVMWSLQNEMRWVDGADTYKQYIPEFMALMHSLDPSRLVSCDGDNRLLTEEQMEVVSMHYNIDGTVSGWNKEKPLTFGEHGKWHYVSPVVGTEYAGPRAYRNFEDAMYTIGMTERHFLEYAREQEVSGLGPFNMINYMLYAFPDQDIHLKHKALDTPGPKPKIVRKRSLTVPNGFVPDKPFMVPNASFYACTPAFAAVLITPAQYNTRLYAGPNTRHFNVFNDTFGTSQTELRLEVKNANGRLIFKQKKKFEQEAGTFEKVSFDFNFETTVPQTFVLRFDLLHQGKKIDDMQFEYHVYPRQIALDSCYSGKRIGFVGNKSDLQRLAQVCAGIEPFQSFAAASDAKPQVIIVGPEFAEAYDACQPLMEDFLEQGGSIVVLEQSYFAPGEAVLSGRKFFSSFVLDYQHPIFAGMSEDDFMLWDTLNPNYPDCRYLTNNAFEKPQSGAISILLECGEGDFGNGGLDWSSLLEVKHGKGSLILCQLGICSFIDSAPQAAWLFRNMLAYALDYRARPARLGLNLAGDVAGLSSVLAEFVQAKGQQSQIHGDCVAVLAAQDLAQLDIKTLHSQISQGASLVVFGAQALDSTILSELAQKIVKIFPQPVYQVDVEEHPLVNGVCTTDVYGLDRVTYIFSKTNRLIASHALVVEDAEYFLTSLHNPWEKMYVQGVDMEALKIAGITNKLAEDFVGAKYGAEVKIGKGSLIICQVLPDDNPRVARFFGRLLYNAGLSSQLRFLQKIKSDADFAIPAVMALEHSSTYALDEMIAYYKSRDYKLNNLGEGLYGWMSRIFKTDGWLTAKASAGKTVLMTAYVQSPVNRNNFEREENSLPDPTITPDLLISCNCNARIWISDRYIGQVGPSIQKASKLEDAPLNKGVNNILIVAEGAQEDLQVSIVFINKFGEFLKDLSYRLTIDEIFG